MYPEPTKEFLGDLVAKVDSAWDLFMERYRPLIYSIIDNALIRKGVDIDLADDAFSNCMIDILANDCKKLRIFDSNKAAFSTYLYLIVSRSTYKYFSERKTYRHPMQPGIPADIFERYIYEFETSTDPIPHVEGRELLSKVSKDFFKYHVEGYDGIELAKMSNCSQRTILKKLRRELKRIKAVCKDVH